MKLLKRCYTKNNKFLRNINYIAYSNKVLVRIIII